MGIPLKISAELDSALAFAGTAEGRQAALQRVISATDVRYEMHPEDPKRVIQITRDGRRTSGRFVYRQFVADED